MSFWKKLFGGGGAVEVSAEPPEDYKGFSIRPEPIREGSQWRVAATIEKDGRSHHLIRADMLGDAESASQASVGKARQMIDEQGERIFGER